MIDVLYVRFTWMHHAEMPASLRVAVTTLMPDDGGEDL